MKLHSRYLKFVSAFVLFTAFTFITLERWCVDSDDNTEFCEEQDVDDKESSESEKKNDKETFLKWKVLFSYFLVEENLDQAFCGEKLCEGNVRLPQPKIYLLYHQIKVPEGHC